jgi:hypothetical protein
MKLFRRADEAIFIAPRRPPETDVCYLSYADQPISSRMKCGASGDHLFLFRHGEKRHE